MPSDPFELSFYRVGFIRAWSRMPTQAERIYLTT